MRQELVLVDESAGFLVEHQRDVIEAVVCVREDPAVDVGHASQDIDEEWKEEAKRVMGTRFLHQHHHRPQQVYFVIPTDALFLQLAAEKTGNLILADQLLLPSWVIVRNIEQHRNAVGDGAVAALLQQQHEVRGEGRGRRLRPRDDVEIAEDGRDKVLLLGVQVVSCEVLVELVLDVEVEYVLDPLIGLTCLRYLAQVEVLALHRSLLPLLQGVLLE